MRPPRRGGAGAACPVRVVIEPTNLAAALDGFAAIVDELAAIAGRTDPERRLELTKLRRRLSDHIRAMRDIGARAFTDPQLTNEFRSRLSTVLNVLAMHQANWPAIAIDEGTSAYRQSAAAAAAVNRAFIEWARAALARSD
jgi:hypothetical protein